MIWPFTSAETHVVRAQENVDLKKRIKTLEEAAENREKQFTKREKAQEERHADEKHDIKRENARAIEKLEDTHEAEVREIKSDHRDEIDEIKAEHREEVADLESLVARLETAAEEKSINVDLKIRQAELKLKEGNLDEVTKLLRELADVKASVKVAEANGKASAAEGIARAEAAEGYIEAAGELVGKALEGNSDILDVVKSIAPKVDLSKMEVVVNVPASQGGNKGGEQKKQ